jgi:magnesium transporter
VRAREELRARIAFPLSRIGRGPMAESLADAETTAGAEAPQAEDLLGLRPELARAVREALDTASATEVAELIKPLHYAEVARLLEQLDSERRRKLVDVLRPRFTPEILTELDETVSEEVAEQLGIEALARSIARLESDDALTLISTLTEAKQRQVLQAIPAALRGLLEEGLKFPEESAGRLMQRDFVAVPTFWTVGEVIDYMREAEDLPQDFTDLFVVDARHRLVGKVPLDRLLRSKRPVPIATLMVPDVVSVPVGMDQEEVAFIFAQQDLLSAPVVDTDNRLIGVITIDDIVDVIRDEATEDLMRLGGVAGDDLYEATLDTTRARFTWLFVNLVTAVIASLFIGLFEATIQQIVVLAVLMPIVASMGGNAGTQTLTVVVRGLAMKEVTPANAVRVLTKEVLVGGFNGILFAVIVGGIAWAWSGKLEVGLVMGAAMIANLVAAGFAGTAIPVGLSRLGVDPAIASAVFLTTVTDVIGFCAFLGLAAWLLL